MSVGINDFMLMMKPAPTEGGFRMEDYWVWCSSVIKGEDGKYHMFASRWSKKLPMHPGWLFESEIVRAVSDTPAGPYIFQEVVLPARGPQFWDGRTTHNPQIHKIADCYVLYYMGSTHPFANLTSDDKNISNDSLKTIVARANKRIGMAVSKSITGPWKRYSKPILGTRPENFDNLLVSNPSVTVLPDNTVRMLYKARGYKNDLSEKFLHGQMKLGIAGADSAFSSYMPLTNTPLFGAADSIEVEDPFLWYQDQKYHMICKDMIGNICGEKYGGIYAESEDGIIWNIDREQMAYSRTVLWDDGISRTMGNMDRPFILFEGGRPTHMFLQHLMEKIMIVSCRQKKHGIW